MTHNLAHEYLQIAQGILSRIVETQMPAIEQAACRVAETIQRGGIVYTLGSGHSQMVAEELYFRAGGMANFDIIHDRTFGRAERLPGYALVLLDSYPISAADMLIVASNSGRNPLPVEMALEAKKRRIGTVGITSLAHSRAVDSRAPQGQRLFEVCDIVIDTCGIPGDATVDLAPTSDLRVCPTSTLAGIFIVNSISGLAARLLLERNFQPPVLVSTNLDGSEERNRALLDFMRARIRGL